MKKQLLIFSILFINIGLKAVDAVKIKTILNASPRSVQYFVVDTDGKILDEKTINLVNSLSCQNPNIKLIKKNGAWQKIVISKETNLGPSLKAHKDSKIFEYAPSGSYPAIDLVVQKDFKVERAGRFE